MKKLFFIIILLRVFSVSAYAEDIYSLAADELKADRLEEGLTDAEKEISGKLSFDGSYDLKGALARLWKSFLEKLRDELDLNLSSGAAIVGISLVTAFGISFCKGTVKADYIELIGCCTAAGLLIGGMDSIVSQTVDSMYRLSDYSKAALPVVFTAAAAGGAVGSAGVKLAAVSLALDILMSISQKLIIPSIYAYIAVSIADSTFPNPLLSAVSRLTKWGATTLMTAMTIAFTAYIGMTGVMSSAVDAAAVKTARTVISNTLPVVGGMISDASAMVLSAAGVLKSCLGVFGLVAVCVLCAGPFAMLTVKMLVVKASSAVADALGNKRLTNLLSSVGNAMALLMGLLGSCGIMLFISLTAAMKAVTG